MNLPRYFFFIFLFAIIVSCSSENKKTFLADHTALNSVLVKSLDGRISSAGDLIKGHRVSVFYFLMPGCPMCEAYTLPINEMDKKFSEKGISFCGIFSSGYYSDEEILSFRNDFKINIPFYRDIDSKLTHLVGATVTPEVFVLDSTATILYSGSIDNWAYSTGKIKMEATEFFLNDALENILNGKPVALKETKAYGCIIE